MYVDSALSLVVPLVVIALVLITKRVVLSLLVGIIVAGFMLKEGFLEPLKYVYEAILSVFYNEGLELSSFYVFGFLIILGILTQLMRSSGGMNAFVHWARKRIKSAKGSEFLAFIAGIIIFIDDYFNALSVGQIVRPLNDANHSTRERLAYIIDSTSAPICILMPISSWGAYILGVMGGIFEGDQGFEVLLSSVAGNYYAWFALFGVFLTIYWRINLPSMMKYQNVDLVEFDEIKEHMGASIWHLLIPIIALFVFVAFFIFYSGYLVVNSFDVFAMLSKAQTGFSLFWGGLCALVISILISIKQVPWRDYKLIIKDGFLLMLGANIILIFAWAIGPVIKNDLQTGVYLANLSKDFLDSGVISASLITPLILFLASGFIGLCTGTSWGTFAIMLPIGVGIAGLNGVDVILCVSAILAGAVYGDHASPISDTTILSATGAGCSVQSHFITQLPYVTTIALIAFISFGVAGYSDSLFLGYFVGIALMIGVFYAYKRIYRKNILSGDE